MGFLKSLIYKLKASWTAFDPQKWDVEVKGQNRGIKLGLCWYGWAGFVVEQSIIILQYSGFVFGSGLVLGLWLSWVCVEQSSFITIFFYDFYVFDLWVCMIFLGLCSCVFYHFEILNSFFFVCFCVLCVFKFEFVLGSGFVFVFLLFLIMFFLFLFS